MDAEIDAANDSQPRDKADLLRRVQQEWAALIQAIDRLTPEQMTAPGPGGWSVKDNLAHLAAWEQFMLRYHLGDEPPHTVMQIDADAFERLDEDGMNAAIYARNKDLPVEDVRNALLRSHEQVIATLEQMSFEDLMKPRFPDDAQARPVILWVIGNTYEHYQEHRQAIQALTSQ